MHSFYFLFHQERCNEVPRRVCIGVDTVFKAHLHLRWQWGTSLVGDTGSIPSQGTKIPPATGRLSLHTATREAQKDNPAQPKLKKKKIKDGSGTIFTWPSLPRSDFLLLIPATLRSSYPEHLKNIVPIIEMGLFFCRVRHKLATENSNNHQNVIFRIWFRCPFESYSIFPAVCPISHRSTRL